MDARGCIGGSWSARHEANARSSGRLPDCLRHHRRAALLTANRDADVAIVEGIKHREITFTRHAEDVTNAIFDQLVDQNLGSGTNVFDSAHDRTHDRGGG